MAIAELLDHLRLEFPDSLASGLVEHQVCSARDLLNADIEQLRDDGILPQRHCRRLARYVLRNGRHFPPLPVVSSDEGSPPRPAKLAGSPSLPPPQPQPVREEPPQFPQSDLTNEVLLENRHLKDDNTKLRNIIASLEANMAGVDLHRLKEQQQEEQDRLRELKLQQELEEIQIRRMEKIGKQPSRTAIPPQQAPPAYNDLGSYGAGVGVGVTREHTPPGNTSSVTSPIRPTQITSSMMMREIPSQLSSHLNNISAAVPIDVIRTEPLLSTRTHIPTGTVPPVAVSPAAVLEGVNLFQNGYNIEDRRRANTGRLKQMGMHIEQQQREVDERALRLREIEDKLRNSRHQGTHQTQLTGSININPSTGLLNGTTDIRANPDLATDHRLAEAMRRIEMRAQSNNPTGAANTGIAYTAAAEARIQSRLNSYTQGSDTVDHFGGIFRH